MQDYGLNIVFYMKSYIQFLLENEIFEFKFSNLNFKLVKLSDIKGSYSLIIEPVKSMEQAKFILNNIKLALILFVFKYNFAAIEIDEEIKNANILDKPRYISDNDIVSGDFEINQTTLFPFISNLKLFKTNPIPLWNKVSEDKFIHEIKNAFSLGYENIHFSEKLSLVLEIYMGHSQFSKKRQFLDLVTILEILKPDYPVSNKSIDNINKIKGEMKNIRKDCEKDSDEYKEFNRYFNDVGHWKNKSISKSLQQFVNKYQNEFDEYEDIDVKIKNAYNIRSNIVHNGLIDDEFEVYLEFLKDFVGKLLKIIIIGNFS